MPCQTMMRSLIAVHWLGLIVQATLFSSINMLSLAYRFFPDTAERHDTTFYCAYVSPKSKAPSYLCFVEAD